MAGQFMPSIPPPLIGLTDKCDAQPSAHCGDRVRDMALRHCFGHGLDARFDGRSVISRHVQSGSKGNHFNINFFADLAVMLSHVAHVIEDEIHNGGIIYVDLHGHPMRLLLVGGRADFGRSTDFGGITDLRAQQRASTEVTPVKTINDLFMVFSSSVLAQAYYAA